MGRPTRGAPFKPSVGLSGTAVPGDPILLDALVPVEKGLTNLPSSSPKTSVVSVVSHLAGSPGKTSNQGSPRSAPVSTPKNHPKTKKCAIPDILPRNSM